MNIPGILLAGKILFYTFNGTLLTSDEAGRWRSLVLSLLIIQIPGDGL